MPRRETSQLLLECRDGCGCHAHARVGVILAMVLLFASCQKDGTDRPTVEPSSDATSVSAQLPPSQPQTSARTDETAVAAATTPDAGADQTDATAQAPTPPAKKQVPLGGGCEMCHVDVEDEVIPSVHYADGISCVKCHGPSEGHSADENNEVKPDHVYGSEQIDDFCGSCHECSRPRVAASVQSPPPKRKICTQCHDAHSVALLSE